MSGRLHLRQCESTQSQTFAFAGFHKWSCCLRSATPIDTIAHSCTGRVMIDVNSWQRFFNNHAPHYMQNAFTRNTKAEVDFILKELKLKPGVRLLDVGCGTGRHAVEFARRGYKVTGVDLSMRMLAEAKRAANTAGVKVEWVHADATAFRLNKRFDAAFCLCEGAFGLLGLDDDPVEHDLRILRNIAQALKNDARFVLTTLNAFRKIREINQDDVEKGRFDLVNMVEALSELDVPEGKKKVKLREKSYTPSELAWLLREVGFEVEHIWGGTAGEWGRRKIRLDEIEFMIVAKRIPRKRRQSVSL